MLDVQFLQVQQCLICNTDWLRFGNYIWSFKPSLEAKLFMMKRSASESKLFQRRSKGKIPGWPRWKERLSRSKLKQASEQGLVHVTVQGIRSIVLFYRLIVYMHQPVNNHINNNFFWPLIHKKDEIYIQQKLKQKGVLSS